MPKFSTSLRLLLVAVTMSFVLTSCFDDKKNDPQPKGSCVAKTTTTTSSGSN